MPLQRVISEALRAPEASAARLFSGIDSASMYPGVTDLSKRDYVAIVKRAFRKTLDDHLPALSRTGGPAPPCTVHHSSRDTVWASSRRDGPTPV